MSDIPVETRECESCGSEYEYDPLGGLDDGYCDECGLAAFKEKVEELRDRRKQE